MRAVASVRCVVGVLDVSELKLRWIGHTLRAEVRATVNDDLSLTEAHDLAHDAERHLLKALPRLTAATVHISPAANH